MLFTEQHTIGTMFNAKKLKCDIKKGEQNGWWVEKQEEWEDNTLIYRFFFILSYKLNKTLIFLTLLSVSYEGVVVGSFKWWNAFFCNLMIFLSCFPFFLFVLLLVCPAIKESKKNEKKQQKINSTNEKWNSSHKKRESAKSVRNPWGKCLEDYTTLNLLLPI